MAWSLPALLRRARRGALATRSTRCRFAHRARASSRSTTSRSRRDPAFMGRKDRSVFRRVVPARRSRCDARPHGLRAHEARSRRALRRAAGSASSSPRTASIRRSPRARASATTSSSSGRSRRGRTSSRRSRPRTRSGSRSSSSGRRRIAALAAELRRRGARLEGYVETERLAELYRGAACLVQSSPLRGLRAPRARGDGVRDAGRRGARSRARGGRGRRGGVRRRGASSPTGSARRSPSATGSSRRGSSAPGAFSWRATAERTLAVYREILETMKVSAVVVSHGHAAELEQLAARARRPGRRDARHRERPGLGRRAAGRRARAREPAPAPALGERQPRHRRDARASTS